VEEVITDEEVSAKSNSKVEAAFGSESRGVCVDSGTDRGGGDSCIERHWQWRQQQVDERQFEPSIGFVQGMRTVKGGSSFPLHSFNVRS